MPPHSRRRWQMPSPDFSRQGSAPATSAPAACRLSHTARAVPVHRAQRLVHRDAGAHQRLVVEVARAERAARPGGGPVTGSPATVSRRAPCESSSMPPGREAARGEHHGVGRQRPGPGRGAHAHARHAARRLPPRPTAGGPSTSRPPGGGAAAVEQRVLEAHPRHGGRQAWGSRRRAPRAAPAGRPTPRPARSRPSTAGSATVSPGSSCGRSSSASARRSAGSSRPRAMHRPAPRRPGRAAADVADLQRAAPRRGRRPAGRPRGRLSASSEGKKSFSGAQADDGEARSPRAGRPRRCSRGASAVGRATPTAVGSSRLRSGSPA